MTNCPHEEFRASIEVARLTDTDGGQVTGYSASISLRCTQCDRPFRFVGVPAGYSPRKPMASSDVFCATRSWVRLEGAAHLPSISHADRKGRWPVSRALPAWHAELAAKIRARLVPDPKRPGCVIWKGAGGDGHGRVKYRGRLFAPHRVLLEAKLRRLLPRHLDACHSCDNPPCCLDEHLWKGTRRANANDAVNKGRHRSALTRRWRDARPRPKCDECFTGIVEIEPGVTAVCEACDGAGEFGTAQLAQAFRCCGLEGVRSLERVPRWRRWLADPEYPEFEL